ncbi:MAG: hypothetical protein H6767_08050 [Candidatus Peribacteria bacterium]|nr:MAG: hypothetical protein H6767_08050 [Candidatus Peribacteria bacterium]
MAVVALLVRLALVIIGVTMMVQSTSWGTVECLTGVGFILAAVGLCLNRIMAVKGTPCLMSCMNKK